MCADSTKLVQVLYSFGAWHTLCLGTPFGSRERGRLTSHPKNVETLLGFELQGDVSVKLLDFDSRQREVSDPIVFLWYGDSKGMEEMIITRLDERKPALVLPVSINPHTLEVFQKRGVIVVSLDTMVEEIERALCVESRGN